MTSSADSKVPVSKLILQDTSGFASPEVPSLEITPDNLYTFDDDEFHPKESQSDKLERIKSNKLFYKTLDDNGRKILRQHMDMYR